MCVGMEGMEGRGAFRIRLFSVNLPWKTTEKWTEVPKNICDSFTDMRWKIEPFSSKHFFQVRNIIRDI